MVQTLLHAVVCKVIKSGSSQGGKGGRDTGGGRGGVAVFWLAGLYMSFKQHSVPSARGPTILLNTKAVACPAIFDYMPFSAMSSKVANGLKPVFRGYGTTYTTHLMHAITLCSIMPNTSNSECLVFARTQACKSIAKDTPAPVGADCWRSCCLKRLSCSLNWIATLDESPKDADDD